MKRWTSISTKMFLKKEREKRQACDCWGSGRQHQRVRSEGKKSQKTQRQKKSTLSMKNLFHASVPPPHAHSHPPIPFRFLFLPNLICSQQLNQNFKPPGAISDFHISLHVKNLKHLQPHHRTKSQGKRLVRSARGNTINRKNTQPSQNTQ